MNPPEGSRITLKIERGYEKIIAPHASGGLFRWVIVLFLMAWLGGWAIGLATVIGKIWTSTQGRAFLIFWLIGWSIGGIAAMSFLYRLLRRSRPETFLLTVPSLSYDSGMALPKIGIDHRAQKEFWSGMYKKRRRIRFRPAELKTLRIRETGGTHRLTIDHGKERIELAPTLTEVEREWLYAFLSKRYQLA